MPVIHNVLKRSLQSLKRAKVSSLSLIKKQHLQFTVIVDTKIQDQ